MARTETMIFGFGIVVVLLGINLYVDAATLSYNSQKYFSINYGNFVAATSFFASMYSLIDFLEYIEIYKDKFNHLNIIYDKNKNNIYLNRTQIFTDFTKLDETIICDRRGNKTRIIMQFVTIITSVWILIRTKDTIPEYNTAHSLASFGFILIMYATKNFFERKYTEFYKGVILSCRTSIIENEVKELKEYIKTKEVNNNIEA